MRHRLARVADFYRVGKGGIEMPAYPPTAVVQDILAAGGWSFPSLEGVTETPIVQTDGTVTVDHGYDAASSLYYWPRPGLVIPQIPVVPDAMRKEYVSLVKSHTDALQQRFSEVRVDYTLLNTAEPLDKALFSYLSSRERLMRVR